MSAFADHAPADRAPAGQTSGDQPPPGPPAGQLLIESRGPADGPGSKAFLRDAVALASAGVPLWLLLIQEGVGAAVPGAGPALRILADTGAHLWVDRFSLIQRGLTEVDLVPGLRVVDMDEVATVILDPSVKVVWH